MTAAPFIRSLLMNLNNGHEAFNIDNFLSVKKALIDKTLDELLPGAEDFPRKLHQAMRHCLFAGGKRLRPILSLCASEAVGADPDLFIKEACALELIHTYSLIHDDLPAMDDDDYRRGLPATHKVFGEAAAVLAGDALLTNAFSVLAGGAHTPDKIVKITKLLADACGSKGLIGGQAVDLESEGKTIEKDLLNYIHTRKTGCLITASVMLGAILGGGREDELRCMKEYGAAVGLAFQITDDILDVLGSTEDLGKKVGSDEKKGKATYPGILGMKEAKKMQKVLYIKAIESISSFDIKADPLRKIAKRMIERNS
jgi:geranylgeranyl diphosphate synthase, type II